VLDFLNPDIGTSLATYFPAENCATMPTMPTLRRTGHALACAALCLAVVLTQGCGRPNAVHGTETGAGSPPTNADQTLPFHQNPDHASDADSARPAVPPDGQRANGTPFHLPARGHSLPAGTLITVQMESSLSIAHVNAGDPFTATVAGPLAIDGDTLIERGTPVSGRVESAQPPADHRGLSNDPGYVRLTLNTITVDGRALALQTSSLFARGTLQASGSSKNPGPNFTNAFQVQKGRRLTFRLIAPVMLADPNSIANRQDPSLSDE
jgi:hypothetical protein